jgi:hypothetical protein
MICGAACAWVGGFMQLGSWPSSADYELAAMVRTVEGKENNTAGAPVVFSHLTVGSVTSLP